MMEALLSALVLAALFVAFGFMNRGRERASGCGCDPGECVHTHGIRDAIRELKDESD
jgi:hypothetical protein